MLDCVSTPDTIVSSETTVSDSINLDGMAKKFRTVTVHARLPESDVAKVDEAAAEELSTRSQMIARIVREWVKRLKPKPRK